PIVAIDLGKVLSAPARGTLVSPDHIRSGDAVGEECSDGLRVEPLHMIAFEESVDDQLPVGGDIMRAAPVEVVAGNAEGVAGLAHDIDFDEILFSVARKPDEPAPLVIFEGQQDGGGTFSA